MLRKRLEDGPDCMVRWRGTIHTHTQLTLLDPGDQLSFSCSPRRYVSICVVRNRQVSRIVFDQTLSGGDGPGEVPLTDVDEGDSSQPVKYMMITVVWQY